MPSEQSPTGAPEASGGPSQGDGTRAVQPPTRLHPFSVVRGADPRIVLQALVPVGFAGFQARGVLDELGVTNGVLAVAAVVVLLLAVVGAIRVVAWQRHTYELTGDAVVERRGILNRRERTVQLDRLQQVEVEQGILDRLVGTAVLRLETASDASEVELELKVVGMDEARRLRSSLLPHASTPEERASARELVHVPLHHVALASITGRRLLLIPVLFAAALGFLDDAELFDSATDAAGDVLVGLGVLAIVAVISVILVLSVVVALVVGILRDGDFRIREVGDDLHVRRGLLTNREAVLPRSRVQKVTIRYGFVRRVLGFASVKVHSAGGGGGGEQAGTGLSEREIVVPLLPAARARTLLLDLLPEAGPLPELAPHPTPARRRARVRFMLGMVGLIPLAVTPARWLSGSWGVAGAAAAASAVVIVALAWWLGGRDYANRGSAVGPAWVVSRSGALAIDESVSPRGKVQGVRVVSNPFQRRFGLSTLVVNVAGPGGDLTMLDLGGDAADGWAEQVVERWRIS